MRLITINALGQTQTENVNSTALLDTSAVADADLAIGCCQLWLDEALDEIRVKVKYSDGSVKTGTVCALS